MMGLPLLGALPGPDLIYRLRGPEGVLLFPSSVEALRRLHGCPWPCTGMVVADFHAAA